MRRLMTPALQGLRASFKYTSMTKLPKRILNLAQIFPNPQILGAAAPPPKYWGGAAARPASYAYAH